MANVVYSVGRPVFDWEVLLEDVINFGTLAGSGALITITFGTTILRINGAGLAQSGGQLTAGTISGFQLFSGATLVVSENGYLTPPTIAQFNALLTVYNDINYNAVFAKEGLTVIGSADAETLRGSAFNDTINTGDAAPDNGNFVVLSYGVDTINGGSFYDIISAMEAPVALGAVGVTGVTVTHDNTGISGKGTVTGIFTGPPAGTVNTTFNNIDRIIGTNGNDSFIAGVNALNSQNSDINWIGGAGNDTFNDQTDLNVADFKINYDAEKFEDHGLVGNADNVWGNFAGEFGVIINLSAATININVGDGVKTVLAGTALDTYRNTDTIVRGQGFRLTDTKDHFVASAIGSRIEARGGDDTLIGGDGRDDFNGDEGNDIINAGDGNDFMNGGLGNDTINAGAGLFDFIRGSNGTDTVNGDVGFDMLAYDGDLVTDTITVTLNNLGPGRGTVTGSLGGLAVSTTFQQMERVRGSFGNDIMQANAGVINTDDAENGWHWFNQGIPSLFDFSGSRGNDIYRDLSGLATGAVVVNYQEEKWSRNNFDGHQWGTQAGEFGVIFNMSSVAVAAQITNEIGGVLNANVAAGTARDTFANTDTLVGIKAVRGTDTGDAFYAGSTGLSARGQQGDDRFVGGSGADEFYGDDDNDSGTGGGGADRMGGGQGNDTMSGGDGNDNLWGDDGNDTLNGDIGRDNLRGDSGLDTLNGGTGNDYLNGGSDNDILNGDAGADELEGQDGIDTMNGGAGNDRMFGGMGNDIMNGGSEADELYGEQGADQMIGGTGADRMFGGTDNDTYTVDNAGDFIFEFAGEGTLDTVKTTVTYFVHAGIERTLMSGAGSINVTGRDDSNEIITGNAGNNSIYGLAGSDTLSGLAGIDTVDGGAGVDRITGGSGIDTLIGGLDSDTFAFAIGDSGQNDLTKDIIVDYTKGAVGVGDEFDFTANLTIGGSAVAATATEAAINATTGVATFLAGSGTNIADALLDIATRMTTAGNTAGEFSFFQVNNTGNFHMFISDGVAGVGANDVVVQLNDINTIGSINITTGDVTILT